MNNHMCLGCLAGHAWETLSSSCDAKAQVLLPPFAGRLRGQGIPALMRAWTSNLSPFYR